MTVNESYTAGLTKYYTVTFPEAFSSNHEVYVANANGTGGWAEVIMSVANVTNTGALLWVYNARGITVTPNFTVKIIAIGPQ